MSIDAYYKIYSNKGFRFSDDILTRYALSLATKPFVILSGISGTGKSKLAQLFEVPNTGTATANPATPGPSIATPTQDYILFTIRKGFLSAEARGNFRYEDTPTVLSTGDYTDIEAQRRQILTNHGGDQNFLGRYELTVDTPHEGYEQIKLEVYVQRAQNPLLRVRSKSRAGETPAWDSREYFEKHYDIGDVIRLEKIDDRHLRIASGEESVSADEAKGQRLADSSNFNNKCFIPVQSNWVDSTELFGYYNALTQQYIVTDLIRFIIRASEFPEIPFFLILDEMNLSKVEHYFSNFLSCLESRYVHDGIVKQEGLTLYTGDELVQTNDEEFDIIASRLVFPENLYVTGTVNIDDSTHMFSTKVLDRANVIEFNEVNLDTTNQGGLRLSSFPRFSGVELATMDHFDSLEDEIKTAISEIKKILEEFNQHFGFRTIAEMSLFIHNASTCINTNKSTLFEALDIQLLQKVLPKFSGTVTRIGEPIRKLLYYLNDGESDLESFGLEEVNKLNPTDTRFPRTVEKLCRMYRTVTLQGFASFLE